MKLFEIEFSLFFQMKERRLVMLYLFIKQWTSFDQQSTRFHQKFQIINLYFLQLLNVVRVDYLLYVRRFLGAAVSCFWSFVARRILHRHA